MEFPAVLAAFLISGHDSLFSVHVLFPQVSLAFIHGFFRNDNADFIESLLCSLFATSIHVRMVH